MKITFLGTSAGKPTKERGLSAIGVEFDQERSWYLFDCGEGTQFQLLHSSLKIGRLKAIFITHLHGDHFYGLPGLLASKKMDDALSPLRVYGPKGLKAFLDVALGVSSCDLGYMLEIVEFEAYDEFVFDKFSLKILPLVHSIDSYAFYICENDITNRLNESKLRQVGLEPSPLYGELKRGKDLLIDGNLIKANEYMLEPIDGKKVIISGDNAKPEVLSDYLNELDLLIHEATYTKNVYQNLKQKVLHTTAHDLGVVAQQFNIKNLIATHISPRYCKECRYDISMIVDEVCSVYEGCFFVANDFDEFLLSRKCERIKNISI